MYDLDLPLRAVSMDFDVYGMLRALVMALRRLPAAHLSIIAQRAGISRRQLDRIRAGKAQDIRLSTFQRLAEVLGLKILGRATRRGAPLGRQHRGKPRGLRREPGAGAVADVEEDDQRGDE